MDTGAELLLECRVISGVLKATGRAGVMLLLTDGLLFVPWGDVMRIGAAV